MRMGRWSHVPTRERLPNPSLFSIKGEANRGVESVVLGGDPYPARGLWIEITRSNSGRPELILTG